MPANLVITDKDGQEIDIHQGLDFNKKRTAKLPRDKNKKHRECCGKRCNIDGNSNECGW